MYICMSRQGDGAHLKAKHSSVIHECHVVSVQRESVILLTTQKAKDEWYVHNYFVML